MSPTLLQVISGFEEISITQERQEILQKLVDYITLKMEAGEAIRLNFICTHNSRRSHLSQIWAQTMAHYFGVKNVACYSGGTEATALFQKVAETLSNQGFDVQTLSTEKNPVYAIKFDENEPAIIGFSKEYFHPFNAQQKYGAVMTCSSADKGCPVVLGAEVRLPIRYEDPKVADGTPEMDATYAARSLQIGSEMAWVFKQLTVNVKL